MTIEEYDDWPRPKGASGSASSIEVTRSFLLEVPMIRSISLTRLATRLLFLVPFSAIVLNASAASAQPPLGSASSFAVLGGPAVTCTGPGSVTGDVGVLLSTGFTNAPPCSITGAVHAGDSAARAAYADFLSAYNDLAPLNNTCNSAHTLSSTVAPINPLPPGVYCFAAAVAMTGQTLFLDAQFKANAVWIFLVNGALTGTNFDVIPLNGAKPCNVYWWAQAAASMTDSNFLGTILAGAAIAVDRGTFDGHALATAAVTLTNPKITACGATGDGFPPGLDKCEEHHDKDRDHHDKHGKHHEGDHCDHERGLNGHHKGDGCEHDRLGKK